jgi:hypothetical protein
MKTNVTRFKVCAIGISVVLLCAACNTVYEDRYARDEGWRPGTVLEVASPDSLQRIGSRDCRKESSSDVAAGEFATVQFFGYHHLSTITVPVKEGGFSAGEHVYVNTVDCKATLEPQMVH